MRTLGFYGKSGTGKSYKALSVAKENDIRLVVDDGLLICDHKILAGKSAKKEKTKYASTKRAIFMDDEHCKEVSEAIKKSGYDSVMVIGTSDRMVNLIAEKLGVAPIDKYVCIEDVSTEEERRTAQVMRNEYGKHVIPLPTFEVKKTFSGYLLDPINTLKKMTGGLFGKSDEQERTIIRPTYSYLGDFEISERVLCQIAQHEAEMIDGVAAVDKLVYTDETAKRVFRIDVSLTMGCDMKNVCTEIQQRIIKSIDEAASVYIDAVNVNVVKLEMKQQ